ncbi:MAG TPA: cysteine desulfurase [Thermoanaerobaculia bacterium]|nr:cysteine desulfurase [Thermoanaerobaculia bacterium]
MSGSSSQVQSPAAAGVEAPAAAASAPAAAAGPSYVLARVRADFPLLAQTVHGRPLVYLDNASTSQKPRAVLEAIVGCYRDYYANVGRGVHRLAQLSTGGRERARETVRAFLGAAAAEEIVFVHGTTEAINLVAQSYGRSRRTGLGAGDEVLVTAMEHHSNLVPWQLLCEERGAALRVVPLDRHGELDLAALGRLLSPRTRIVAVTHVSNVLGTINPVAEIADMVHRRGAVLLVDGAQAAPHLTVDVAMLGCDFYAFSGHKVYGPSGIGVLYGRAELLAEMPPWQGGGGMIETVRFEGTTYAPPPQRFEAGTPNIEGAIGLAAALDYLTNLGQNAVALWEGRLLQRAVELLGAIPGVQLVHLDPEAGARERAGLLSFVVEGVHPHDVATVLDGLGIAVRAGHHCAQPLMEVLELPATTRASFGLYNTLDEVVALAAAVERVREVFA